MAKHYAFWKESHFPYIRGHKIWMWKPGGLPLTHKGNYGSTVRPLLVLTGKRGRKLLKQLRILEEVHAMECKELDRTSKEVLEDLLGFQPWDEDWQTRMYRDRIGKEPPELRHVHAPVTSTYCGPDTSTRVPSPEYNPQSPETTD